MDLVQDQFAEDLRGFACTFALDDLCFREHFPGRPVLPGAFIIGLCLRIIYMDFGCVCPVHVERFSFRHCAPPGCYALTVRAVRGGFACALAQSGRVFAKGRIEPCV